MTDRDDARELRLLSYAADRAGQGGHAANLREDADAISRICIVTERAARHFDQLDQHARHNASLMRRITELLKEADEQPNQ